MCEKDKNSGCQKGLTDHPEKCTPEQIKKCHGDVKNHPCDEKK